MNDTNTLMMKNRIEILKTYLYGLVVFFNVIFRSTFNVRGLALRINVFLIACMMILSLLFDNHNLRDWLWLVCGLLITVGIYIHTHQYEYFLVILLIFSLIQTSPKKLFKVTLYSIIIALLIVICASLFNIIPNLVFYRNGIRRYALGTDYPLAVSSFIFMICSIITILVLNSKKNPIIFIILFIITAFILDNLTNSRNDEFFILILAVILCMKKVSIKFWKAIVNIFLFAFPIIVIFSIFITNFIPYTSNEYAFFNELFSGRLSLQAGLINNYSVSLFGNNIPQIGLGAQTQNINNYFYIDNSYTRWLFMGGILFFIFLVGYMNYTVFKLNKIGLSQISMVLIIIEANSLVADTLSVFSTCIMLPFFFIDIYRYKNDWITGKF